MVKSTSSTATVITTSGTSANNTDQHHHHNSWHRLQSTESSALELLTKTNVERLKYLDRYPVFVFPNKIYFYVNDSSSCRHEIKLINPYDWRINYQFFAQVPKRYEVSPAKGSVGASCTSNVSIRLLDISPGLIGTNDSLRLQVQADDYTGMGTKDINVYFEAEKGQHDDYRLTQDYGYIESSEEFKSRDAVKTITNKQLPTFKSDTQGASSAISSTTGYNKPKPEPNHWPPSFYVIVVIFCGIILWLPNENESKVSTFMSISTTPKFVACYVLGLLTSLICKLY